ncbi:CLUMA_CG019971, isoform A [Clunio marinus]|uniref:Large ribosomal subunit protein mL40 n=1 Tax=Clunio marinus TaxID=568069 RepID=A0A1J1J3Q6_9DIPT|nr:CLUMA_CG019971, isoform A [Clunio marinus]
MIQLLSSISRLTLSNNLLKLNGFHTASKLNFHYTPVLYAEPLKKKKKLDPAVVRAREDRKRKKLEKQIRRLEKNSRQLKPIDELEVPFTLIDEKEERTRKLPQISEQEQERRIVLLNKWAHYRLQESLKDLKIVDKMMNAQMKALQELRFESEELYQHAIQPDIDMIPFVAKGPVETPPKPDYEYIDGDYNDVTRVYDGEGKPNS